MLGHFLVSTHICDSERVRRQSNTNSADADLSSQGEARRAWGVQWPTQCQPEVSVKNTYSSLCARVLHACPAKGGFPDALATNTHTHKETPIFSETLSNPRHKAQDTTVFSGDSLEGGTVHRKQDHLSAFPYFCMVPKGERENGVRAGT